MAKVKYCANCDSEATQIARHDGIETPLCDTCAIAYEWGQASPSATLMDIDANEDGELEEGDGEDE